MTVVTSNIMLMVNTGLLKLIIKWITQSIVYAMITAVVSLEKKKPKRYTASQNVHNVCFYCDEQNFNMDLCLHKACKFCTEKDREVVLLLIQIYIGNKNICVAVYFYINRTLNIACNK